MIDCSGCGRRHAKGRCLANHITCFSCGVTGHYSRRFPNTQPGRQKNFPRGSTTSDSSRVGVRPAQKGTKMQLHSVEGESGDEGGERSVEEYVFHELRHEQHSSLEKNEWSETLKVDDVSVKFKLGSGASRNVLSSEVFHQLPTRRQRLRPGPRLHRHGAKHGYLTVLGLHTAKLVICGVVHIVDFLRWLMSQVSLPSWDFRLARDST